MLYRCVGPGLPHRAALIRNYSRQDLSGPDPLLGPYNSHRVVLTSDALVREVPDEQCETSRR